MAGFGFEAVMDMPWTEAREFAACVAEARKAELVSQAVAGRIAQAGHKDWQKIMRELG